MKRVADEQITKEHGSTPNFTQGDDKPRMSTAAQQARRKIAQPRGRMGANRSHTASPAVPNPFSQNSQQPAFGNTANGVNFGASSQSFPQPSPASNSAFSFQAPQSSSFTFGAPSGTPNPFENLNGTGGSQDISMESPQKKTAMGNTFGANSITFGQPPQQPSSFGGFGGNQNGNTNGSISFGQQPTTSAPSNPFGQPSQASSVMSFGKQSSAPAVSQSTTSGFRSLAQSTPVSGQSSLPAFGAQQGIEPQPQTSKFVFGQTTSSQPTSAGFFGSTTPASQPSGSNPFGAVASQASSTGFGLGQTPSQTTPSTNPFAGLGSSKPAGNGTPTSSTASTMGGSYPLAGSQPMSAPAVKPVAAGSESQAVNPFSSLFGGAGGIKPTAPAAKPSFKFGEPSQASATASGKENASPNKPQFSFGATPQPLSQSTADGLQSTTTKPPLGFGTTTKPTDQPTGDSQPQNSASGFQFGSINSSAAPSLFGKPVAQPEVSTVSKSAQNNPESQDATPAPAPKFKFGGPSQPISSGGLFTPAKPSVESSASPGGLFSKLNSAVETSATPKPLFSATSKPAVGNFSPSRPDTEAAAGVNSLDTPKATAGPLFGVQPRTEPDKGQSVSQSFSMTPGQVAGRTTTKDDVPPASAIIPPPKSSNTSSDAAVMLEPTKRPVYTKGPSRVPGHTNAQQFQEYDRDYRLHSLNHGLQKKLASLNPRTHDFDNIIRHYIAARENIGASLGLYVRSIAGTKRKGDDADDREEELERSKRHREENKNLSSSFGGKTSSGSKTAMFGDSATQPKKTNLLNDGIPAPTPVTTATGSQAIFGVNPAGVASQGNSTAATTIANPFTNLKQGHSIASAVSTTPTKSPPKKPTFEMPKFGSGANTNFLAAFGQQAKANSDKFEKDLLEKRKAEEFDSEEDDEQAYNKKVEEENRSKRAKIDSLSKGGFTPSFGTAPKGTDAKSAFAAFGSASDKKEHNSPFPAFGSSLTEKGSMPPFSGISSTPPLLTGFRSSPLTGVQAEADDDEADDYVDEKDDDDREVSGSSNDQADDGDDDESADVDEEDEEGEEAEDSLPEDEVPQDIGDEDDEDDENDLQAALDRARKNPNAGKSLFERIEPNPRAEKSTPKTNGDKESSPDSSPIMPSAKNPSVPPATWGSSFGKSTPEQPAFSPFSPTTGASTVKTSNTFSFTPPAPSNTPTPGAGASIFSGGSTRDGPVPGEGLFGSRPSTPINVDKNGNLAKSVLTSPAGTDNTWKPGASISFANGDKLGNAPTFKFTAASPGEKDKSAPTSQPFGSLFGTPVASSSGTATPNLGFQFGSHPGPAPGYLGAVSHLGAGSVVSSAASSRATSPGLTDNESVATNDTDETSDEPQTTFMDSRAGEENESTLWEGRSKALMFISAEDAKGTKSTPNDWNSVGLGMIRVLKDKTNDKTRIVFRVEPSGNILFNSHLVGSTTYESVPSNKSGAVRGALMHKGALTRLVFKLKTPAMADELAKILEENKGV